MLKIIQYTEKRLFPKEQPFWLTVGVRLPVSLVSGQRKKFACGKFYL